MSDWTAKCRAPNPFISIVTVSLNAARTIEDTLASVRLQSTTFDIEHLCVDGGSTDGTREIIDRWAEDSRTIRRIYETDYGIFDAMNKGLRAARGEYILYLNADDFLVSCDVLAKAVSELEHASSERPDLIFGDVLMGDLARKGLWRYRRTPRILARVRGSGLFPLHQGMLAKRALLLKVGGFDSRLRLAADVNQFYDLERLYKPSIRFFGDAVSFMNPGGAANDGFAAMWRGSLEIYQHLRESHGALRSGLMLFVKTLQSVSEIRYGRVPCSRWMVRESFRCD